MYILYPPSSYSGITSTIHIKQRGDIIRKTEFMTHDPPTLTLGVYIRLFCLNKQDRILKKKSRIRETKHLSTDADSSTDAIGGWTKAKSAKKNFFLRRDFRPLPNKNVQMLDHFFLLIFPKDSESLKILDIQLQEVGAKRPLKKTKN